MASNHYKIKADCLNAKVNDILMTRCNVSAKKDAENSEVRCRNTGYCCVTIDSFRFPLIEKKHRAHLNTQTLTYTHMYLDVIKGDL